MLKRPCTSCVLVYVCLNATTFSAQQTLDVFVIYDNDNMLNIVDIR